jgi:hypothetical protein
MRWKPERVALDKLDGQENAEWTIGPQVRQTPS